jgi:hypothetical protein
MESPFTIPSFKTTAAAFSAKHGPGARFAVLRIWSAPHFYPLMLGHENRIQTSFVDYTRRRWLWMFQAKDLSYSEYSIHRMARERIEPFKRYFGKQISVKRDRYLIMGTDEKDLRRLATALVYAVQTRPWRLEIDLWKSFVNVDLAFVEALRDDWLE